MKGGNRNENFGAGLVGEIAKGNGDYQGESGKNVCGGSDSSIAGRNGLLDGDLEQECGCKGETKANDQAESGGRKCEEIGYLGGGDHANAGLQGNDKSICLDDDLESCLWEGRDGGKFGGHCRLQWKASWCVTWGQLRFVSFAYREA